MFQKQKELQGHLGAIYTCVFDGEFLYTGSADKFITRWNLKSGTQDKFAIKFESPVYTMELFKHLLFVGLANGALNVFDLKKRIELKHFSQHKEALFSISSNPNKNQLYVGDALGNLSVWDIETLDLLVYLPLDSGKIRDIQCSIDGSNFALTCQDGTIRIFDTEFFNEISTISGHKDGATAVLFDPTSSEHLISGGKDAMLRKWNWKTNTLLLEIPAHNFAIYRLIHVGSYFVSASRDKTLKLWTIDLDFIKRLDSKEGGHHHSVNDVAHLNDSLFASVGDDKRIILWEKS
jgi:WD40 repeat protein